MNKTPGKGLLINPRWKLDICSFLLMQVFVREYYMSLQNWRKYSIRFVCVRVILTMCIYFLSMLVEMCVCVCVCVYVLKNWVTVFEVMSSIAGNLHKTKFWMREVKIRKTWREKRRRNSASQMSLTFSGYVEKQ